MVARSVQYQDVEDAANSLKADRKRVTARAVLARVGRGSMSTVHSFLMDWKSKQPPEQRPLPKLSQKLEKALEEHVRSAAIEYSADVQRELEEQRELTEDLLAQNLRHEAEQQHLRGVANHLQAQLLQLQNELDRTQREADQARHEIERQKAFNAEQLRRVALLMAEREAYAQTAAENTLLKEQLDSERLTTLELRREVLVARAELNSLSGQIQELRGRLDDERMIRRELEQRRIELSIVSTKRRMASRAPAAMSLGATKRSRAD